MSSARLDISKVASIEAIIIHIESVARKRPGQIRLMQRPH
jgi:hypothetical protein